MPQPDRAGCISAACSSGRPGASHPHRLRWHAQYHPGEPPDLRSQRHAAQRGYDLSDLRARQLIHADFDQTDLLLAMDWDNLALAESMCPPIHQRKLRRFTEFCVKHDAAVVPDPYYDGDAGFEHVLDLIEDASAGLLIHVRQRLQLTEQREKP